MCAWENSNIAGIMTDFMLPDEFKFCEKSLQYLPLVDKQSVRIVYFVMCFVFNNCVWVFVYNIYQQSQANIYSIPHCHTRSPQDNAVGLVRWCVVYQATVSTADSRNTVHFEASSVSWQFLSTGRTKQASWVGLMYVGGQMGKVMGEKSNLFARPVEPLVPS